MIILSHLAVFLYYLYIQLSIVRQPHPVRLQLIPNKSSLSDSPLRPVVAFVRTEPPTRIAPMRYPSPSSSFDSGRGTGSIGRTFVTGCTAVDQSSNCHAGDVDMFTQEQLAESVVVTAMSAFSRSNIEGTTLSSTLNTDGVDVASASSPPFYGQYENNFTMLLNNYISQFYNMFLQLINCLSPTQAKITATLK